MDSVYYDDAAELGTKIAQNKYELVFGGAKVGLMGRVAASVRNNGGKVVGVIPESIHDKGITCSLSDEIILTKDLRERKAIMDELSDIFIALPGGFGTLEEIVEMITLKQLGLHNKPIIFLNTNNFYSHLLMLFENIYKEKCAKSDCKELYYFSSDVDSVFSYIESYNPVELQSKWI